MGYLLEKLVDVDGNFTYINYGDVWISFLFSIFKNRKSYIKCRDSYTKSKYIPCVLKFFILLFYYFIILFFISKFRNARK